MPFHRRGYKPSRYHGEKSMVELLDTAPEIDDRHRDTAGSDGNRRTGERQREHHPIHVEPRLPAVLILTESEETCAQKNHNPNAIGPKRNNQRREHRAERSEEHTSELQSRI